MKIKENLDYIIVLGAHVNGVRLSKALLERTRRALEYLEKNPKTRAVLSGGQGEGETIGEAEAMCRYLEDHGISRERLILEDRSTNTKENLDFSLALIGDTECTHRRCDKSFSCISRSCHWEEVRMQKYLSDSIQIPILETGDLYSQRNSCHYQG